MRDALLLTPSCPSPICDAASIQMREGFFVVRSVTSNQRGRIFWRDLLFCQMLVVGCLWLTRRLNYYMIAE